MLGGSEYTVSVKENKPAFTQYPRLGGSEYTVSVREDKPAFTQNYWLGGSEYTMSAKRDELTFTASPAEKEVSRKSSGFSGKRTRLHYGSKQPVVSASNNFTSSGGSELASKQMNKCSTACK